MKTITNGKRGSQRHTIVVPGRFNNMVGEEIVTTMVSWCGTTKFDWFVGVHPDGKDHKLHLGSEIAHVATSDLDDPRYEPLDVIIIHLICPSFSNARSLTPRMAPEIGFALFSHDFEEPKNTQALVFKKTVDGKTMRNTMAIRSSWEDSSTATKTINKIISDGFMITPGTTLFDLGDLKAIANKFKKRIKKAI